MLHFSGKQEGSLAYDVVRRHAESQALRTVECLQKQDIEAPEAPEEVRRMQALRQVLRSDVADRAGAAAPHLIVDLDLCASQFVRSLEAGAVYRESAASAQLLASASLGLRWLGDERFCATAPDAWTTALPAPREPAELKAWAEAGWTDRFEHALARMKALQEPAAYALHRAVSAGFSPAALRNIANTVFPSDQGEPMARFVNEERQLFRDSVQQGAGPLDPRLEALCIGADLVHGLGRFVRLAAAGRAQTPPVEHPYPHLLKAIDELAG